MSDEVDYTLLDLVQDLAGELPIGPRKVLKKALECGWQVNPPGGTFVIRLNHPTDDLAEPVYMSWVVRRTPSGKVGFSFDSCGTRGLHSLRPSEIEDYLEDPSSIYPTVEELETAADEKWAKTKWDDRKDAAENMKAMLGTEVIAVEDDRPGKETAAQILARAKKAREAAKEKPPSTSPSPAAPSPARALRVQLPSLT